MTLLRNLEGSLLASYGPRLQQPPAPPNLLSSPRGAMGGTTGGVAQPAPHPWPSLPAMITLPERFVAAMCDVQDRVPEPSRISEYDGYVHVSSLSDICTRQYAIASQYGVQARTHPTGARRIVWEIGNALERHVLQNVCQAHGHLNVARNVHVVDDEYRIMGRPDAVLQVAPSLGVVVEVKTMNVRDWERLDRPLQEHVFQAAMYHWLMERQFPGTCYSFENGEGTMGHSTAIHPHNLVILLYVAKDFTFGSPYKEFHVNVRTGTTPRNVELALAAAAELRDLGPERLPSRTVCDRVDCTRARECPVSHLCFNLPAGGS